MPFHVNDLPGLVGPTLAVVWVIGTIGVASASGVWWLMWGRRRS